MARTLPALALSAVLASGCGSGSGVAGPTAEPVPEAPAPTSPPGAAPGSPSAPTAVEPSPPPGPRSAERPPPPAGSPEALADRLVSAERTIRSDAPDDAALAEAGRLQQAGYRELAAQPSWRDAVLAAVPAGLRDAVRAQADAVTDLLRLTTPQPRLPAWRIVAPPPPDVLLGHYRAAEAEFGVGWEYLAAIHLVESRMGRIRGTSPAGAQGPMQFMPGTWAQYGEGDVQDPRDAILAAGRYLRASGAPGRMDRALFAYNRSEAYVRAVTAHAAQLQADPRTYGGYWHWQVYYRTTDGDRLLPVGYDGSA